MWQECAYRDPSGTSVLLSALQEEALWEQSIAGSIAGSGSFDQVHYMDRNVMLECDHRYCKDMVEFLFPSLEHAAGAPILYQFGDDNRTRALRLPQKVTEAPKIDRFPNLPVLKKIRKSIRKQELQRLTDTHACFETGERIVPDAFHLEPIVFKLKTQRHYGRIYQLADLDIPWEQKRDAAIFRGELNGNYPVAYARSKMVATLTVHERCRLIERCWIAYQHAAKNSTLVDAKLTLPFLPNNSKVIPRFMGRYEGDEATVDLYGNTVSLVDMLHYKALIMLEGNDVSSGLKWALFSNSVVLIPEPTVTSWAMEEWLEPWVHYIPINVNMDKFGETSTAITDVEEKMQWIIDNDGKAKQIARAGKLWIADLVLHPDVQVDETSIFDEIARRYATHFVPAANIRYW